MKKIIYFLFPILFVSCYKYAEQTTPTLSGEYILDKVTVTQTESTNNMSDSIYYPGDLYIDTMSIFPMNTISVGFTRWHFDYSSVSFCQSPNEFGEITWSEKYFYDLIPGWTIYDYGHVQLKIDGRVITFKILEDGLESLTFRSTGQWFNEDSNLSNKSITIQLTRIGP